MDRFWKYRVDHIIFWTATVGFHMYTRLDLVPRAGFGQFLLEVVVRNGLLAGLIYLNLQVLMPVFARQKKIVVYALLLTVSLGCYALLKNVHDVYLYGYVMGDAGKRYFFYNAYYNFSIALFYLAFSVAMQLSRAWYFQREQLRRLELEKLNTELQYLKAQLNPHFLFNSINTVYFQIDKQNATARQTLSAFSEMLRYQLYECNGTEVPVEKEIGYLQNYVALQRMRKDENYLISFFHQGDLTGFSIAPLLLLPFVENAFKHVSHFPDKNEIIIDLHRAGDVFCMRVYNTKDDRARNGHDTGGIGLGNVRRRLALLYPDRHTLTIQDGPQRFEVTLRLHIANGARPEQTPHTILADKDL